MNERDEFVTLHTGRPPIIERIAWLLVLANTIAVLWHLQ
jgi:hypothetical protein